jgi:hypothetical protein
MANIKYIAPTKRRSVLGIVCVSLALFTFAVSSSFAADESDNLDDQLLGDLEGDLLEGLEDLPTDDGKASPALDQKLLQELDAGEDIGDEKDPLKLIAQRMRSVEQLIGEQNTSENTQKIQKLIVADLSQLIEALNKQCQGQCKKKASGSSAGASKSKPGQEPGDKPSSDSTERQGTADVKEGDLADVENMMKKVWGHLPPKVREQINSSSIEEFLPKYEKLIERYYRRLAEEDARLGG